MTEQSKEESNEQTTIANDLEAALRGLLSLGRLWSAHGLRVGKLALQTSAHSLELTANTLGQLSKAIAETDDDKTESP